MASHNETILWGRTIISTTHILLITLEIFNFYTVNIVILPGKFSLIIIL